MSVCMVDRNIIFGLSCFMFIFGCQYQCNRLPGKTRLQNNLLCVEQDVTLYSVIVQSSFVESLTSNFRYTLQFLLSFNLFFFLKICCNLCIK